LGISVGAEETGAEETSKMTKYVSPSLLASTTVAGNTVSMSPKSGLEIKPPIPLRIMTGEAVPLTSSP